MGELRGHEKRWEDAEKRKSRANGVQDPESRLLLREFVSEPFIHGKRVASPNAKGERLRRTGAAAAWRALRGAADVTGRSCSLDRRS